MVDFKCAFNNTLITNQFACEFANPITRRDGPDIGCNSEDAHHRCAALLEHLKQNALPSFDVSDDLLEMPKSVLLKIKYGGLLGLQHLLELGLADSTEVSNINFLVDQAVSHYKSIEQIPAQDFLNDITGYQLRRRRSR